MYNFAGETRYICITGPGGIIPNDNSRCGSSPEILLPTHAVKMLTLTSARNMLTLLAFHCLRDLSADVHCLCKLGSFSFPVRFTFNGKQIQALLCVLIFHEPQSVESCGMCCQISAVYCPWTLLLSGHGSAIHRRHSPYWRRNRTCIM